MNLLGQVVKAQQSCDQAREAVKIAEESRAIAIQVADAYRWQCVVGGTPPDAAKTVQFDKLIEEQDWAFRRALLRLAQLQREYGLLIEGEEA